MSVDAQTKRVYLSVTADRDVKREIANSIAAKIVENTQKGMDKDGDRMASYAPYSKAYKESKEFKQAGKKKNLVDLTLSGDMLGSVSVVSVSSNVIKIGFKNEKQFEKASWHIDGTDSMPIRDFWGLPFDDVAKIITDTIKSAGESLIIEAQQDEITTQNNTPSSFEIKIGENG